jgi:hypothetical protein
MATSRQSRRLAALNRRNRWFLDFGARAQDFLSDSWRATATSKKAWAWMALTGRRPAETSLGPPSASLRTPRPALLFDGQLKTRQAPGTSFESYLIPVLADPKKLIQALDTCRDLKSFPSPKAVNTTTGPQLPKYVSVAFGSLDLPWTPAASAPPAAPSAATASNPKTRPHKSSPINWPEHISLCRTVL